jgi:hypothetical protein
VLFEAVTPAVTLTFEGRAPTPIDLTYDDVRDPVAAQKYQSRLVRFKNVKLTSDFTGKRFEAKTDAPFGMAAKFFPIHEDPALNAKAGTTFKSVTGIFDFFYSYKLCPRSAADVELESRRRSSCSGARARRRRTSRPSHRSRRRVSRCTPRRGVRASWSSAVTGIRRRRSRSSCTAARATSCGSRWWRR